MKNKKTFMKNAYKELQANALRILAKEHKNKCQGNCNISLFSLKELYENLVARSCDENEDKIFC